MSETKIIDKCERCEVTTELVDDSYNELCAPCHEVNEISRAEQAHEQLFHDYHSGQAPDYVYINTAANRRHK